MPVDVAEISCAFWMVSWQEPAGGMQEEEAEEPAAGKSAGGKENGKSPQQQQASGQKRNFDSAGASGPMPKRCVLVLLAAAHHCTEQLGGLSMFPTHNRVAPEDSSISSVGVVDVLRSMSSTGTSSCVCAGAKSPSLQTALRCIRCFKQPTQVLPPQLLASRCL